MEQPTADRVCSLCNAILRWYRWRDGGGYLHTRRSGQFYITGHTPTPAPEYRPEGEA